MSDKSNYSSTTVQFSLEIGLGLGYGWNQITIRGLGFQIVIQGHLENMFKSHVTVETRV